MIMSFQGDDPNRPQERQQTGGGRQGQPRGGQRQPPQGQPTGQRQQQPQGQPGQRPPQQPQGQRPPQQQQAPRGLQQGQPGAQPQGQPRGLMGGQPSMGQQQTMGQPMGGTQQRPPQQPGMGAGLQPGMQQRRRATGPRFQRMTVDEIIRDDVVTAVEDTPIPSVAASMAEHNVGSVVVVEEDEQRPVGILTDRKIALALETVPDISERSAEDLLSGDLTTGTTEMTVFDALDRLSEENIRRLPIVDDEGALQGVVTLDDLLVLLGGAVGDAVEVISAQIERDA